LVKESGPAFGRGRERLIEEGGGYEEILRFAQNQGKKWKIQQIGQILEKPLDYWIRLQSVG
jgi:hypothetical protein